MPTCSICFGPLAPLGPMGSLYWFRCRNCGMDQHRKVADYDGEPTCCVAGDEEDDQE